MAEMTRRQVFSAALPTGFDRYRPIVVPPSPFAGACWVGRTFVNHRRHDDPPAGTELLLTRTLTASITEARSPRQRDHGCRVCIGSEPLTKWCCHDRSLPLRMQWVTFTSFPPAPRNRRLEIPARSLFEHAAIVRAGENSNHNQHDQQKSQAAARIPAPACRVWPDRQKAQQEQHQQNDQNQAKCGVHGRGPFIHEHEPAT